MATTTLRKPQRDERVDSAPATVPTHTSWRRRWIVGCVPLAVMVAVSVSAVAQSGGGVRLDPASGAPGTRVEVAVDCGDRPLIYRKYTQDAYVQGTIGPFFDGVDEVAPSTWMVAVTAGTTDDIYWATCGGNPIAEARLDAEAPHLWFGPRPANIAELRDPKTTIEGTDCPPGTAAHVRIDTDGNVTTSDAPIDAYGDWTVTLPVPVGEATITVTASCGSVAYEPLRATTTTTSTSTSTSSEVAPSTPANTAGTPEAAPAATAQPGQAGFTG